nr:MAG: GNAT family N-acetyltransferase [Chloroflexota bacterium]
MAVRKIVVVQTAVEHCDALAELESIVFPTLSPDEWFTSEMYCAQVATFPEGQFVALAETANGVQVVGATTTFRTNETFEGDDIPYYFDFIGRGYLTTHEPDGEWLYGTGLMVHPAFRRMGIGTRLYEARRELVKRLNLRGELVGGLLPGYENYRGQMSVADYARRVVAGELTDPTLTMQLRNGFVLRRLLPGFIDDPRSDNTATLIARENPDYRP